MSLLGRLHKEALELSMTTAFIYLPLCRQCRQLQGQGSGKNAHECMFRCLSSGDTGFNRHGA